MGAGIRGHGGWDSGDQLRVYIQCGRKLSDHVGTVVSQWNGASLGALCC